jgi:AcrR family transcriptional regulator
MPATAGLRADARQNRDRIVEVARALFAERGLDVPMAAIARRAGVGVATLYRRFPTKESLVAEVFADQFAACVSVVDEALADPDPWRGFCTLVEKVCAMQAVDRGFSAAVVASLPRPSTSTGNANAAWRGSPNSPDGPRPPGGCAPTSARTTSSCCSWPTAASSPTPPTRRWPPPDGSSRTC